MELRGEDMKRKFVLFALSAVLMAQVPATALAAEVEQQSSDEVTIEADVLAEEDSAIYNVPDMSDWGSDWEGNKVCPDVDDSGIPAGVNFGSVYASRDSLLRDIRELAKAHDNERHTFYLTKELYEGLNKEFFIQKDGINYNYICDLYYEIFNQGTDQTECMPDEGDYLREEGRWSSMSPDMDLSYNEESYVKDGVRYRYLMYSLTFKDNVRYTTTAEQEAQLGREVEALCNSGELARVKNGTVVEKATAATQWVNSHVRHSDEGNSNGYYLTAHAAYYEGHSDCRGNACLLYRILRQMNVPCRIVYAATPDYSFHHLWVVVKVGSKWYSCDGEAGSILAGTDKKEFFVNQYDSPGLDAILKNVSTVPYGAGAQPVEFGWSEGDGTAYWYENGIRQGTYDDPKGVIGDGTVRGREICDMASQGWYWLDSCYNGAKAVNKEVWMPYIYQQEKGWSDAEIKMNAEASGNMAAQVERDIKAGTGKWVRYDDNGAMYKGWYTVEGQQATIYPDQVGNTYYYGPKTGLMAKGDLVIDGINYHFDEISGVLTGQVNK